MLLRVSRSLWTSCLLLTKKMIEVEKKFAVNNDVLENLKESGAKLLKESTFTDIYYDTNCYLLTSNNFWLRQRDDKWELKSPAGRRSAEEALMNSSYKESYTELEILNLLVPIFYKLTSLSQDSNFQSSSDNFTRLRKLLHSFHCIPFCKITTKRQTYVYEDFHIDLDITDSGHQVGEIELLANSDEDISAITDKIESFSRKLGIPYGSQVGGKLGHYLKMHNPEHYEKLFKLKILI